METLKQKTARGLFWGGMNTMVQQVIGLLFGIILGRLLAPSDYGMMAIISVFSLVAVVLQDSGFKVALANEKAPTHADYNAVFWFNILMGIALYAALFLSAPLIGRWYNTPPWPSPPRRPVTPPTSTRPRLARRHQGLLLPLHLRMAMLAV